MKIAELFAELGFKTSDNDRRALGDFAASLSNISLSSALAALGLGATAAALGALAEKTAKTANELTSFSVITGISTDSIQRWQSAVERAGGTAEDATTSLKAIQNLMTQIKLGTSSGNFAMAAFGINVYDDAETILRKMANTLKSNVDPALRSFLVNQLGITEGMQRFLQTTKSVDDELAKSPIMSKSDVGEMTELWHDLVVVFQDLKKAGTELAVAIGPFLKFVLSILDSILVVVQLILQGWNSILRLAGQGFGNVVAGGVNGISQLMAQPAVGAGSKSVNNNVSIHVNGADMTPVQIARTIQNELKRFLSNVARQEGASST